MAEELITVAFHPEKSNAQQVMNIVRECKLSNQNVCLVLHFFSDKDGFRFTETEDMQITLFENRTHIETFNVINHCTKDNEHNECFNYFVEVVRTYNNYETKSFGYINMLKNASMIQQSIKLANAIRSNNNNNHHIERFVLTDIFLNSGTFQPIWNALLDTGVESLYLHVSLGVHDDNNNYNGMDCMNLCNNTALKQLVIHFDSHNWGLFGTNLFESIKKNKGLEKLEIPCAFNKKGAATSFREMLCENTTLLYVKIFNEGVNNDHQGNELKNAIIIHTKFNRIWKQYNIMKCEEKSATATATDTATATATTTVVSSTTTGASRTIAEIDHEEKERKKKFKMRAMLTAFMGKAVMRDVIIFSLLTEYFDAFDNDTNKETNSLFLMLRMLRQNNNIKKRSYEE